MYLILTKSPTILANLKYFLLNTSILQIVHASLAFFSQQRIIPNTSSTAILHYGPCRAFGPNVCFISHHLVLAIALGSALGVASTVIFRHRTLRMGTFNRQRVIVILLLSYVPAIIMIILPFTVPWDFATVRAVRILNIRHTIYPFMNHLEVASYTLPCVTGILTKRIITMVNRNTVMSSKTKKQSKSLAYGLALQNILPCISYIPPATAWVISQFGEVEVLYNEHLLTIFISLPPLMDPLLSFYFIVPFRNAIYGFFTCKKTAVETITVSNASGKVLMAKRSIRI
ncbi:unnamed protein product [Caenorhabditis brenneri]